MKFALKNLGNVALKACYHHTNLHYHVEIHKTADVGEGLLNASVSFGGSSCPLVCFRTCKILPSIMGDKFMGYLSVCSQWHHYSFSDTCLLWQRCPSLGLASGFIALCVHIMSKQFNKTGRWVRGKRVVMAVHNLLLLQRSLESGRARPPFPPTEMRTDRDAYLWSPF